MVASVLMASLGEYLCARKEMEDIPLYSPDHTQSSVSGGTPSKSHDRKIVDV